MEDNKQTSSPAKEGVERDTVAQNPNPRANENLHSAEEKLSTETKPRIEGVGTEITDGEGG